MMNESYCGMCRFEKEAGANYCSTCGRPLSIEALKLAYEKKTEYEEWIQNEK